jgi:ferredoxin
VKDTGAQIPAENVPGRFYVDDGCIGCGLCPEIAPANFRSNLKEGYEWVCKQPASREEERLCLEAIDLCPVSAIRDDGRRG